MLWMKGFTPQAIQCVQAALQLAGAWGHIPADTGHLLLGILKEDQGEASAFLLRRRVGYSALAAQVCSRGCGEPVRLTPDDFTGKARQCLEVAMLLGRVSPTGQAGPQHLLRAVLEDETNCAAGFLRAMGVDIDPSVYTIAQARQLPTVPLPLTEVIGHTMAESLWMYPPGIPLVVPGEILTADIAQVLGGIADSGVQLHSDSGLAPHGVLAAATG